MRAYISIALLLASCSEVPVATDAEMKAATKLYNDCEVDAIIQLDDGKSDAYTVASAASTACGKEFNSMVEVYSRGQRDSAREEIARNLNAKRKDMLIPLVMKVRKAS